MTPYCHEHTLRAIGQLPSLAGGTPTLRMGDVSNNKADGPEPARTDNGNYIVDVSFGGDGVGDARAAAAELRGMVGVVEHGLFCAMATEVIVAGADGVYTKAR